MSVTLKSVPAKSVNLVIVGQGAIGLLYYRFFNEQANIDVSLVCSKTASVHPNHLIYKNTFQQKAVEHQLLINHATPEHIKHADAILVCVKSYQVAQALNDINPHLSASSMIILCHNGMGAYDELPSELKKQHSFLAMLTTHGCKKSPSTNKQYTIEHTGKGKTDIGVLSLIPQSQAKLSALTTLFNTVLTPCIWNENIGLAQWTKLAINCVINPITAMHNINNGDVLNDIYRDSIKRIIAEVVAVANAEGITLSAELLLNTVLDVAEKTAKNSSSMRCDVQENRKTEIDYINGYVVQLSKKHHIDTPENKSLWQDINHLAH